jgi:hypothetical protein
MAFLYLTYHYGWTGQRQFASRGGMLLYYGAPAFLSIALFAALRLRQAYQAILSVCCLLATATVYGVEGFLLGSDRSRPLKPVMSLPLPERASVADRLNKQYGIEFDVRDQHQVIADLQAAGIEAVPQIILPLLEKQTENTWTPAISIHGRGVMPLGGIANKVTVVCNETGRYLIYKSDEHGFHNSSGKWRPGAVELLAVGNSLTFGACVPSEKNFVAVIRQRYAATLNLAMPGEGPLHMLAVLKEYASYLRPRIVLWFYSEASTFTELQYERRSRILVDYLDKNFSQSLRHRQVDIDRALTAALARQGVLKANRHVESQRDRNDFADEVFAFLRLSALRGRLGLVYGKASETRQKLSERQTSELKMDLNLLGEILSIASDRVSDWGGRLYFVYLPSWQRYLGSPEIGVKARERVLELVENLGISIIDIHPAFQTQPDPLSLFPFRGPGRYNEDGHRLVGETVIKSLSSSR